MYTVYFQKQRNSEALIFAAYADRIDASVTRRNLMDEGFVYYAWVEKD